MRFRSTGMYLVLALGCGEETFRSAPTETTNEARDQEASSPSNTGDEVPEMGDPEMGDPEMGEMGDPEMGEMGDPEVGEMGDPEVGDLEMGDLEMGDPEMGDPEMGDPEMGDPEPEMGSAISVAAGGAHTCALLNEGTILCWGSEQQERTTPPLTNRSYRSPSAGRIPALCWRTERSAVGASKAARDRPFRRITSS